MYTNVDNEIVIAQVYGISNKWQRATSATNMSQNTIQSSILKSLNDNKTQSEKIQHKYLGLLSKSKYTTKQ